MFAATDDPLQVRLLLIFAQAGLLIYILSILEIIGLSWIERNFICTPPSQIPLLKFSSACSGDYRSYIWIHFSPNIYISRTCPYRRHRHRIGEPLRLSRILKRCGGLTFPSSPQSQSQDGSSIYFTFSTFPHGGALERIESRPSGMMD